MLKRPTTRRGWWMTVIGVWFASSAVYGVLTGRFSSDATAHPSPPNPAASKNYKIVNEESVDSPSAHRIKATVTLPQGLTKATIEATLKASADDIFNRLHPDALIVFAYNDGDDTNQPYTVASLTRAPGGEWDDAGKSTPLKDVTQFRQR